VLLVEHDMEIRHAAVDRLVVLILATSSPRDTGDVRKDDAVIAPISAWKNDQIDDLTVSLERSRRYAASHSSRDWQDSACSAPTERANDVAAPISGLKEPSRDDHNGRTELWLTNGPRTSPTGYWSRAEGRGVIGEFTWRRIFDSGR